MMLALEILGIVLLAWLAAGIVVTAMVHWAKYGVQRNYRKRLP